jgi:putative endonuclease
MTRGGSVYIMTNKTHSVLYIGVTAEIISRIYDHKTKRYPIALQLNIIVIN